MVLLAKGKEGKTLKITIWELAGAFTQKPLQKLPW